LRNTLDGKKKEKVTTKVTTLGDAAIDSI